MKRFIIPLATVAVVVSIIFAGCAAPAPPPVTPPEAPPEAPPEVPAAGEPCVDVWDIPALVQTRGIFGWYGEEELWTFKQVVKDINAAGGVRGLPIKVSVYETGDEPGEKQAQMGKILDTKPLVIASPGYVTTETMPMVVKEEVFCLCVSAIVKDDAEPFFPWDMTFIAPEEEEVGPAARRWIEEQPEIKSVVALADPYRPGFVIMAQRMLEALEEIGVENLGLLEVPETTNYGPIAVKALGYNADAYIMNTMEDATAKIIIEWDRRGFKERDHMLIFKYADTPKLYEAGKGYLDGCYVANIDNPGSDNPLWVDLQAAYAAERPDPGTPSWNVPLKYDCILLIAQALEETGATGCADKLEEERLAIRDYIRNAKGLEGIQYSRSFTDGIAEPNVFLFQIQNNAKVLVGRCE